MDRHRRIDQIPKGLDIQCRLSSVEPVLPVGIQTHGMTAQIGSVGMDFLLEDHGNRLPLVLRHHGPLHHIVKTTAVEPAKLHRLPKLLIDLDLCLDGRQIFLFHVGKIALISQHAKGCHCKPGIDPGLSQRLVIRHIGHMSRNRGHGIAVAVAVLDQKPGIGIRIVRSPDLREIAKCPQIKAVSAGSTAFKEHLREGLGQCLCQPVKA